MDRARQAGAASGDSGHGHWPIRVRAQRARAGHASRPRRPTSWRRSDAGKCRRGIDPRCCRCRENRRAEEFRGRGGRQAVAGDSGGQSVARELDTRSATASTAGTAYEAADADTHPRHVSRQCRRRGRWISRRGVCRPRHVHIPVSDACIRRHRVRRCRRAERPCDDLGGLAGRVSAAEFGGTAARDASRERARHLPAGSRLLRDQRGGHRRL